MRKCIFVSLSLILSACSSVHLEDGIPYLVGKPISHAINYMGYPDDERTIAGNDVYSWHYERTFTTTRTVYTPYSGTAYGVGGGMSYSGQTSSVVPEVHNNYCNIRLIVDRRGIVRDWDWQGNYSGCRYYSDTMSKIVEDAQKDQAATVPSINPKKNKD